MSVTLNFQNVSEMRAEMTALLGIPLVSAQGPTPAAKELITQQERIASLEQNLADAQFLMEEAKSEIERLRPLVSQNAPPPHLDPLKLQARLDEALSERDVERGKVSALEIELKRLQEPSGKEDAPKAKRQRKAPQREGGSLDAPDEATNPGDQDHAAEMAHIASLDIQPIAGNEPGPNADFLALPQDTLIPGRHVLVQLDDEGKVVEGWCNRQFEGTDRWDVKLKRGGHATVPAPRIRDFTKGFDDTPRDYLEEAVQNQRLDKPGADTESPVAPKFVEGTPPAPTESSDGVVDRLATHEERGQLAEKAKALRIPPDRMVALMQREFQKNASAELTIAEVHKLFGVMEADAKVPF